MIRTQTFIDAFNCVLVALFAEWVGGEGGGGSGVDVPFPIPVCVLDIFLHVVT